MADMVSSRYDHSAGRVLPGVCTLYAGLYGVTCRIVHHTAPVLRTVSSTQRTQRAVVEEYHAHLGDVLAETTAGPIPRPQPIRRASGRIRVPEIKERTQ